MVPAKRVPALQPKRFGEENKKKKNACCCGFFPPGRCAVGWELALGPESTLWERKGPVRDSSALFQMLLGGHRDTEDFSQMLQHITSVENQTFP